MKVKPILTQFLEMTMPSMHKMRRLALIDCISSILNGGLLTVTGMGRGIAGATYEKHRIKRSDRLCSNLHLYNERTQIYTEISKRWIIPGTRPVILVDWSDLDDAKNSFLISATLAYDGRSITLYAEVHSIETKESPEAHFAFMTSLKNILPDNCKPIIVADAGFKVPWHELVLYMGWDYVGRVRQPNHCQFEGEDWQPVKQVFKRATTTAKYFSGLLTMSNEFKTNFVLFKKPPMGRHSLTADGEKRRSKASKVHSKSGKEPWLLATSLEVSQRTAERVVRIYQRRMQIEEGYRDFKNHLYGFGFEHHESKSIKRISILILIAVLASLVLLLIGTAAEQANLSGRYQANTTKTRRVISLNYLGLRIVADPYVQLTSKQLIAAFYTMLKVTSEANNGLIESAGFENSLKTVNAVL